MTRKYIHAEDYDGYDEEDREVNVDELKSAVKRFAEEEYPDGITMYADYRDEMDVRTMEHILDSNDPMLTFYDVMFEAYLDTESYYLHDLEGEFDTWCEQNDYDFTSDDLSDNLIYLQEYIEIRPDYDHYLDQEFNCRLLVDNGDANYDFSTNPSQDNDYEIGDGAGIIWLGEQFGYTIDQMQEALSGDEVPEDKFLKSLVEEAENGWGLLALTFLCKLTLKDLIEFKEKKCGVTVDLNGNCGFYDGWNGGGSLLNLDCPARSVTIPYDKIYELVPDYGSYSVSDVYGLSDDAYEDAKLAK